MAGTDPVGAYRVAVEVRAYSAIIDDAKMVVSYSVSAT